MRKLYKPFVSHCVAVSKHLDEYLAQVFGVPVHRRSLIANVMGQPYGSLFSGQQLDDSLRGVPGYAGQS